VAVVFNYHASFSSLSLAKESPQHGIKTEDFETEDEETAVSCTSQNMERDAPWTAWSKMLQPHEEPASSSTYNPQSTIHNPQSTIHNPQSTIHNPQSTIFTFAFIRG
jgi:hypothetical protein